MNTQGIPTYLQNVIFLFGILVTITQAAALPTQSFPQGYRVKTGSEAVFKFLFETLEVDTGNKTFECRYDVIVKPGPSPSQDLLVVLENVNILTDSDRSADEEEAAMLLPIIITLENDGVWSTVAISPNETEFSLLLKNILLEHLVFNSTEMQEHTTATGAQEPNFVMEGTPLGNCKMDVNVTNYLNSVEVNFSSILENCEGDTDFTLSDNDEASTNSTIDWRLTFDKTPLQFKTSELNVNYTLTTSESHVLYQQSLEFVKFRPSATCIDVSDLTERYDPDGLSNKLSSSGPFSVDQL